MHFLFARLLSRKTNLAHSKHFSVIIVFKTGSERGRFGREQPRLMKFGGKLELHFVGPTIDAVSAIAYAHNRSSSRLDQDKTKDEFMCSALSQLQPPTRMNVFNAIKVN